ncbi:Crp/Fnr family transcriptional regulator [Lutispora saccharofermentans]|uniref:Crp/Fnr family transcriptional regulator n=1 Tax=Lutispora saccharofermentans TaxID=3024236 RepID=A0ABT1NFY2_9FIRM|nr:Crp/Fnr family transcriptional regulator [Lutispora saccharofermentans]
MITISKISKRNKIDIEGSSPWIDMSYVDWSCITKDYTPKGYKKHEVIYHQQDNPDCVYLVKKGRVRLDIYGFNGEKRSLFIAEAGTFFGELSTIDEMPNMCSATAATYSIVYSIPKTRFIEELSKNYEFSFSILKMMSKKIRLITTQIKQLSFNDSNYRVCYALTSLANQYGSKTPEGYYKLNIKFTHQEMASLTGLSRVSVSNILLNLASKGIIDKDEGFVIIIDMNRLSNYLLEN